ncbi:MULTISPECIES: DUF397 domain-containing protein [Nocardiopsis]|uniref:DUF397 domain-containing protein n=1 Tax=Nocardiopsis TaxID=2013 RepID=UPI000989652F|nr:MULTISPECIES: DUF397 domain-containing protein [Nocardiopsis]
MWPTGERSTETCDSGATKTASTDRVLVRDTQNRGLGHVAYSAGAWASFLRGVELQRS